MSTLSKDGGPAFPQPEGARSIHGGGPSQDGMSLRDYFAAAALTGLTSNPDSLTKLIKEAGITSNAAVAMVSLQLADALLEEKSKR